MKMIALLFAFLFATTCAPAQQALDDPEITTALRILNAARKDAGLNPVTISASLSKGCYLHAKYLAMNMGSELTSGMNAHKESPTLKGHTVEGEKAGENSVIHYVSPIAAIDEWLKTFYHRIPLLQPGLTEIGIGYSKGKLYFVSLIDCITHSSGTNDMPVVYYPGIGQDSVPVDMGGEIPDPVGESGEYGFPVTVYFSQYQSVKNVVFKLIDKANRPVECFVSTPDKPATDFTQWNSICAIPKHPLLPSSKYTVKVSCLLDDVAYTKTYSFTTAEAE